MKVVHVKNVLEEVIDGHSWIQENIFLANIGEI